MRNQELAIRKIQGVYEMVRMGNEQGFQFCNMKATEQKLKEILALLKK